MTNELTLQWRGLRDKLMRGDEEEETVPVMIETGDMLVREIERLTRERDVSRAAIDQLHAAVKTAQELAATRLMEVERLRAECDRLLKRGDKAELELSSLKHYYTLAARNTSEPLHVASFPVALTQPTLDALIAEADRYILPVDVKMGAATFRKGVNVGTMLRGLKVHAERQTATVFSQGASRDASSEKSSVCQCPEEFCANEMADSGFGVVNATGPCRKRAAKRT